MSSICFGATKEFTAPKKPVPPITHQPSKQLGFYKTNGHSEELQLEFQLSLQSPFRKLSAVCDCQQTLMKFHLCINLQNRKNAP